MALTKKQRNAKINKIKRINERRAEIERAVNDNRLPKEYLDAYEAAMRSAVHDSTLINARGNISHGKKAVDSISSKSLDALLQKETAGQATKKTYKYYKKYREETERIKERSREYYPDDDNPFIEPPENEDNIPFYDQEEDENEYSDSYEEYLADRDYVYENMQDDPDWYQAIKAFFTGVAGLKSYHQLKQAHEKFISMTPEEQNAALQAAADRQLVGYFG
jgi:hypothetical protein